MWRKKGKQIIEYIKSFQVQEISKFSVIITKEHEGLWVYFYLKVWIRNLIIVSNNQFMPEI